MIRLAEQNDAAQIAAIYRPYCENTAITFETVAPDAAEFTDRIARIRRQFPWLVDERDSLITGYAYASPHRQRAAYRWVVEVTVYVQEGSAARVLAGACMRSSSSACGIRATTRPTRGL
jgi:L-amino acid N-acyltransferase YncA